MRNEESHGKIFYDAVYKRVRTVSEFQEGKEEDAFDVLRLHAQKVEYIYDFNTKKCTKQPLTREWRDFGIPNNAKSIGESYIGSSGIPNAGVLTTVWEDEFKGQDGRIMYWIGHWTYEACLPIELELYEKTTLFHKGLASHDRFFNILPGVSPDAFNLRKECQNL